MLHSLRIVVFDETIKCFLQFTQRQLKFPSEGRQEKLFQEEFVELLAKMIVRLAGQVRWQVLDVRGGKKRFKGMDGRQTAIFVRGSSANFFDRNSLTLKKGHDAACQYVHSVHCIFCGIDFCKGNAGLSFHDCFDIDTARSRKIANVLDRTEEKRFLEKRAPGIGSRLFLFLLLLAPGFSSLVLV